MIKGGGTVNFLSVIIFLLRYQKDRSVLWQLQRQLLYKQVKSHLLMSQYGSHSRPNDVLSCVISKVLFTLHSRMKSYHPGLT